MQLVLFLQAPPPWVYYTPLVGVAISMLALGFSVYATLTNRSRDDGKALEARLKKLELDDANHEQRFTGFQQQIERVADEANRRADALEKHVGPVSQLQSEMAAVKNELKHVVEGYGKIEKKIDQLFELILKRQGK